MRGLNGFLSHCAKCHQVNGEGGQVGPELSYPVNVTEYWQYWQAEWMPKFIAKPADIRHNSKMPPYRATAGDAQAEIRDILAHLRAMKKRKLAPRQ